MRESTWVAPELAPAESRTSYAQALELARAEASAGRAHLKLRTARWSLWAAAWPLHRKWWSLVEARALRELRAAGLRAVEPCIAGARVERGAGEAFLATRLLRGPDLERAVVSGVAPSDWPERVGAALAAVHRAGFVHRDAFLRNLVRDGAELWWIDAHRGGRVRCAPWRTPRGFLYDVACLELDLRALAGEAERKIFWAVYLAAAPAPPPESRVRAGVAACRARLIERFRRRRPAAQAAQAARCGLDLEELLRRWGSG